jgi:hypothetical protein
MLLAMTTAAGVLAAQPAWAAPAADLARSRGFGLGRTLGLICCFFVVVLVGIGVVIGMLVGRRRRGNAGPPQA